MTSIYPVILAVPDDKRNLSGKNRTLYLSRHARDALKISARKSRIHLSNLLKDENGVPQPCGDNYWSLSHKPAYVAAVVAPERIGIDIEEIRKCSESLFRKVADHREWGFADTDKFKLFFRYWTAKEAVLKAVGTGLKDLSKCKIAQIIDENNLVIDYMNKRWVVEHLFFNGHIASVVNNSFNIKWTVLRNRQNREIDKYAL